MRSLIDVKKNISIFVFILCGLSYQEHFTIYSRKNLLITSSALIETLIVKNNFHFECAMKCSKRFNCFMALIKHQICKLYSKCEFEENFYYDENAKLFFKNSMCFPDYSKLKSKTILNSTGLVYSMVVLPNCDLASGSEDKNIKIWDLNSGNEKMVLTGHSLGVFSLAVLNNGDLVSGSFDGTIKIWNLENQTAKLALNKNFTFLCSLAVLNNGDLASGSFDGTIKIWNLENGTIKMILIDDNDNIGLMNHNSSAVCSLVVLKNGDLASGSYDGKIKIWNLDTGSVKLNLVGHNESVNVLKILHNGDLISGSSDKTIKIWNVNNGTLKCTLKGHSDKVSALTLLYNGYLVSGSLDGNIKIWNLKNKKFKIDLNIQSSAIISLFTLPNGNLACGLNDTTIRIFSWH